MLKFIHIISQISTLLTIWIALIYGPFAKTWLRALLVVLAVSIVASVAGIYEIVLVADGKQNILAVISFPINLLIIASVARLVKLAVFSLFKKRSNLKD